MIATPSSIVQTCALATIIGGLIAASLKDASRSDLQRPDIPPGKGSCRTAEVAAYFVESHVPAVDIRRMLT